MLYQECEIAREGFIASQPGDAWSLLPADCQPGTLENPEVAACQRLARVATILVLGVLALLAVEVGYSIALRKYDSHATKKQPFFRGPFSTLLGVA